MVTVSEFFGGVALVAVFGSGFAVVSGVSTVGATDRRIEASTKPPPSPGVSNDHRNREDASWPRGEGIGQRLSLENRCVDVSPGVERPPFVLAPWSRPGRHEAFRRRFCANGDVFEHGSRSGGERE